MVAEGVKLILWNEKGDRLLMMTMLTGYRLAKAYFVRPYLSVPAAKLGSWHWRARTLR